MRFFRKSWSLANRRAIITGGASGIGLGIARALHARGAHLILVDRDAKSLATIATEFPNVETHALDVTDRPAIERMVEAITASGPLHLLFNNAGISVPRAFEDTPADEFDRVMAVNFQAVVDLTRACLPLLRDAARVDGHARIVNTSSLFGLMAPPENTAYCSAKFAVTGFGQALSHELEGTGVGVTTVHPGGIATRIVDNPQTMSRYSPEEARRQLNMSQRLLVMPPDRAGEIIVHGVERRRPRILVGADAVQGDILRRLAPVRYWAIAKAFNPRLRDR